jgi:ABC-type transport system involved in multi-copper enzyme maturation permease subunit
MVPLGPVFRWESLAIARRGRSFVVRCLYGAALLASFCLAMASDPGLPAASFLSLPRLDVAVAAFFRHIITAQGLAVLVLTPALFGGAIAGERERGTLPLLLTSRVSSIEILFCKLSVRLTHLVILLALPVPVFCLLNLLGRLDPRDVLLTYAATLTSCFVIAAIALLASTLTQRSAGAIVMTYVVLCIWLALPFLAELPSIPSGSPFFVAAIDVIRQGEIWTGITNPLYVAFGPPWWFPRFRRPPLAISLSWMMGSHLSIGTLLLLVAAAALRPLARGMGSSMWGWKLLSVLRSKRPLLPRRRCGDRPVLWKESHAVHGTLLVRLIVAGLGFALVIVLCGLSWRYAAPAFHELGIEGYGSEGVNAARDNLNEFLRVCLVVIYLLWAPSLAVCTALCVTSEIEKGTWATVLATPLSASEIAWGKLAGTFLRLKWPGYLYLLLLALGLAAGAIHPIAGAFALLQIAVCLAVAAGLGMAFSLVCNTSLRALLGTMLALLAMNGGFLLFCMPLAAPSGLMVAPLTPFMQGLCLANYEQFEWFIGARQLGKVLLTQGEVRWALLLNFACLALAALLLLFFCLAYLETLAGGPRRPVSRGAWSSASPARPRPLESRLQADSGGRLLASAPARRAP